jgi:hypothetical protein
MPLKIRHRCVSHQRAAAAQFHRHPSHHFPSREAAPRQPAVWAEKLERRRLNDAAFYMQQRSTQQQQCTALHFDSPAPLPHGSNKQGRQMQSQPSSSNLHSRQRPKPTPTHTHYHHHIITHSDHTDDARAAKKRNQSGALPDRFFV